MTTVDVDVADPSGVPAVIVEDEVTLEVAVEDRPAVEIAVEPGEEDVQVLEGGEEPVVVAVEAEASREVVVEEAADPQVEVGAILAIGPPGLSAYQVAVRNGFEGTQEEWLASLRGDPGDAQGAHIHQQQTPAAIWEVSHPLAYTPNVTVVDSAGTVIEGDVSYLDHQTVRIEFAGAFSGTAYFS